jgi:hypothetical protein
VEHQIIFPHARSPAVGQGEAIRIEVRGFFRFSTDNADSMHEAAVCALDAVVWYAAGGVRMHEALRR